MRISYKDKSKIQRSIILLINKLFSATTWEEYEKLGKECESMSEVVNELKKINQSEVERLAKLTSILIENNKYEELKKICSDDAYRDELFKEYGI